MAEQNHTLYSVTLANDELILVKAVSMADAVTAVKNTSFGEIVAIEISDEYLQLIDTTK